MLPQSTSAGQYDTVQYRCMEPYHSIALFKLSAFADCRLPPRFPSRGLVPVPRLSWTGVVIAQFLRRMLSSLCVGDAAVAVPSPGLAPTASKHGAETSTA
jgi:hypothetical protein